MQGSNPKDKLVVVDRSDVDPLATVPVFRARKTGWHLGDEGKWHRGGDRIACMNCHYGVPRGGDMSAHLGKESKMADRKLCEHCGWPLAGLKDHERALGERSLGEASSAVACELYNLCWSEYGFEHRSPIRLIDKTQQTNAQLTKKLEEAQELLRRCRHFALSEDLSDRIEAHLKGTV